MPPGEFVAARKAAVAQARAEGDADRAALIGGWRKPAVAAWLVNLLAHQQPEALQPLLELGTELQAAQAALDGPLIRELSRRRQELLREVMPAVDEVAEAAGQPVSESVRGQITATLQAALIDADAAAAVSAGHLVAPLEVSGFGSVDVSDAVVISLPGARAQAAPTLRLVGSAKPGRTAGRARAGSAAQSRSAKDEARAAARERTDRLAAAKRAQTQAETAAGSAARTLRERERALERVQAQWETARRRVADREAALAQARDEAAGVEAALTAAQGERDDADARLQAARAERDRATTAAHAAADALDD